MKSKNRRLLVCALLCALALLSACTVITEAGSADSDSADSADTESLEQSERVTIDLTGKSEWIHTLYSDISYSYCASSLQFSFANHTDKVVKGVQGELIIMNMFGDTLYEGMLSVDELSIEPRQTVYRQVTDYGYKSEFSPSFIEYDQIEPSVEDTYNTIYNLSAEDMSIDFQLTALAYADGSFERFD